MDLEGRSELLEEVPQVPWSQAVTSKPVFSIQDSLKLVNEGEFSSLTESVNEELLLPLGFKQFGCLPPPHTHTLRVTFSQSEVC